MSSLGNKDVMAANIKYYMELNNKDRQDLCHDLNIKYTTLCDWINAKTYPRIDAIELMANYFHISKAALIEERSVAQGEQLSYNITPMPKTYSVPRLGVIACGEPILAEQNIECYDAVPDYIKCDFTLVCKGDSMINARIFDGDIVCVKQQSIVESGAIAAVLIGDDEATLKRVHLYEDHIVLEPENPMYKPLVFWGEDMNNVRILGKATHFISVVR